MCLVLNNVEKHAAREWKCIYLADTDHQSDSHPNLFESFGNSPGGYNTHVLKELTMFLRN